MFSRWLFPVLLMGAAAGAQALERSLPDFTQLVESNSAAVVNISTTQKRRAEGRPQLPKGLEIPDLPENSPPVLGQILMEVRERLTQEAKDNEP